jgi:hypothetical protein
MTLPIEAANNALPAVVHFCYISGFARSGMCPLMQFTLASHPSPCRYLRSAARNPAGFQCLCQPLKCQSQLTVGYLQYASRNNRELLQGVAHSAGPPGCWQALHKNCTCESELRGCALWLPCFSKQARASRQPLLQLPTVPLLK